jgi:hypothetical protein
MKQPLCSLSSQGGGGVAELVWMAMYFMLSFLLPFHPIMVLARKREDNKYDFV